MKGSSVKVMATLGSAILSPRRTFGTFAARRHSPARASGSDPVQQNTAPGADATPVANHDNGIDIRGASVRHGRRLALENVTGRFEPGSLTAVVGPNGAGKTTLLNLLAGLTRPYAGEVVCPARRRNRVAYLQQQTELNPDFPVAVGEVIGLGRWRQFGATGAPPPDLADAVAEAAEAVGLTGLLDRRITELSVGQTRRAFFARLLLLDPEIILLDEPFAAVDAHTQQALLALMARWHDQQRTVIAVVHDLEQARAHFPSSLILARTPIAWGDTNAVLTDHNLAQALTGKTMTGTGLTVLEA